MVQLVSYFQVFVNTTVKLIILLVLLVASIIVYRLHFHPLARIPGPRFAKLSNIWHAYHVRNGRMLQLGKTLHKTYGPVVRIGPNEVWLNSKQAFSSVYSVTNGFPKSNFYVALALHRPEVTSSLELTFPDTLDLLGEFDLERYRLQRRLIGPLYQKRNLLKYEGVMDEVLRLAIVQLDGLNGEQVDLKEWMHMVTVECLTAIVLSWSPSYLRSKTDHGVGEHAYLGWRRKSVFGLFPWAEVVDAYSRTLGRFFARTWDLTFKPPQHYKALFPLLGSKTAKRIKVALRPVPPKDNREDLAAELIQLHKDKPEFTDTYLKRMVMTNFGAGHETTTSTLISAMAMLGSHPEVQKRILSELSSATCDDVSVAYSSAIQLNYTQASIKEAQRLYPVIGMSLSRQVPSAGFHIDGHYLPPGTTVGCNPISLHRNPDIFGPPDAEDFRPDRWLDLERAREMDRYNLIWGGGGRMCPGRNLAELIIFKVVPTLVKHFEIEVQIPRDEDITYYFMAMLTGVKVRFKKRAS